MNQHRHSDDVLNTYRYLRLAMILLVALLGAALIWQVATSHCLQTSISAYYYTPVRGVFVATLCAVGLGMIVYEGNTNTEDVLLNFTGSVAFVIAFVPTAPDRSCAATNVPSAHELRLAITNNISALLIVGIVGVLVAFKINRATFSTKWWDTSSRFWLIATNMALVAFVVVFLIRPRSFQSHAHGWAATALFTGIFFVVWANAISYEDHFPHERAYRKYANRYGLLGIALTASAGGLLLGHALKGHSWTTWLFWLESDVIVMFGIFWIVQTQELWNSVKRDLPSSGCSDQCGAGTTTNPMPLSPAPEGQHAGD